MSFPLSRSAGLLVLLAGTAWAADPVSTAELNQQVLPALGARRESAEARARDAEAFFAGRSNLAAAFPDLYGRPLLDPVVLAAEREALARASRLRAAQRVEPPPDGLPESQVRRWADARRRALDSEEQADLYRTQLIASLEVGLSRAPDLAEPNVAEIRAPLRAARDAARAELIASADRSAPDAVARADAAASAEQWIPGLVEACTAAMAVPSDTACGSQANVLASGLGAYGAVPDRAVAEALRAVIPLLDGAERDAVVARVRKHDLDRLAAESAEIERRIATLKAQPHAPELRPAAAAPVPAPVPAADASATSDAELDAARARSRSLARELAALELAVAEARAASPSADEAQSRLTVRVNAEAIAARQEADEARDRARADDANGAREVAIREATAELLTARASRHDAASSRVAALRTALAAREARAASALALPPLDPARPGELDAAYLEIRESVLAARAELDLLRGERRGLVADNARLRREQSVDGDAPALASASATLDLAMRARVSDVDADILGAAELLQDAKGARRLLRPGASVAARSLARRTFLHELWQEIFEIPLVLDMHRVRGGRAMAGLSGRALDVTAWWAALWLLAELMAVFLAWRVTRARLPALVADLARRSARDEPSTRWHGDPRNLVPQGTRLAQRLLDAAVIGFGIWWLGGRLALVGVALLALLGRRARQASADAVDVLVATPEEPRPALLVASHEDRERVRSTASIVLLWFFAVAVLGRVALHLLDADRLAEVVDTLGYVAGAGIGAIVLAWWAPSVHQRAAADPDPDRVVRWVVAQAGRPGGARFYATAAVGAVALVTEAALEALRHREGDGRLGWFGAALQRRRLGGAAMTAPEGQPDPLLQERIAAVALPPPRADELAQLRAVFERWQVDRILGLVSVTGDAGSGRSALLEAFARAGGLPVTVLEPPLRLVEADAACRWLGRELAGGEVETEEVLVRALGALEPRIVMVDDLQRVFLRIVGGYDALRLLLSVMQRTAHRHFWVVSCHASAWAVLEGLPQRVPLEAFGAVVRTTPLSAVALREWLVARATRAGVRLRWDGLTGQAVASAVASERAENAWFRLLTEASGGNPRLAMTIFSASLRLRGDGVVDVVMPATVDPGPLDRGSDVAHFLLAALRIHQTLDLSSLSLVLNLPVDKVRSVALDLAGHGVIREEAGEWSISGRWAPAVERVLRQRHFALSEP